LALLTLFALSFVMKTKRFEPFILFQDAAGVWCAAPPGFRNLLLDPVGWGSTRQSAVACLLDHPDFQERARVCGWGTPRPLDFLEVDEPEGAQLLSISYEPEASSFRAALRRQSFKLVSNK
jgi:hypothetical protein